MSLDVYLYIDVDTGRKKPRRIELFDSNITHNLTEMAEMAEIYQPLWRPEEIGAMQAKDIIVMVETGLKKMKDSPEEFKKFDAPNGWGTYEQFTPWIEEYLQACKENPKAIIGVLR